MKKVQKDTRSSHQINPYDSEEEAKAWKKAIGRELKEAMDNPIGNPMDHLTNAERRKVLGCKRRRKS